VAHETQDSCHGHPQQSDVYHYHNLTNCLDDKPGRDQHSELVGYAIDGFGIFGNWDHGRRLTSADFDECHGHRHEIDWDGKRIVMYHYHATPDFSYTVGCMRGRFERSLVRAISGPPPRRRPGRPGGPPPRR
jgi:calcineurin-like phosphoesterase family protein